MTASGRTVTLPGGRQARLVEADDAGEFVLEVADGIIAEMHAKGVINDRQRDAAEYMARLYGIGEGKRPWAKGSGGQPDCGQVCPDNGQCDCRPAHARKEYAQLMMAVPFRCQHAVGSITQGHYVHHYDPKPLWRRGLDAVADRLKLARVEEGGDE